MYGHLKPQKLHGVRMLVYGCVWMFESSKGFFFLIYVTKKLDILSFFLYKYRLVYGYLKPQKLLGVRMFESSKACEVTLHVLERWLVEVCSRERVHVSVIFIAVHTLNIWNMLELDQRMAILQPVQPVI